MTDTYRENGGMLQGPPLHKGGFGMDLMKSEISRKFWKLEKVQEAEVYFVGMLCNVFCKQNN